MSNREFIFRGKRISNGSWVHGLLIRYWEWSNVWKIQYWNTLYGSYTGADIDISTVGQYTGLLDRKGKKIFEGDVVKITGMVKDLPCTHIRVVSINHSSFGIMSIFGEFSMGYFSGEPEMEVIGNVHDNRELIEVTV